VRSLDNAHSAVDVRLVGNTLHSVVNAQHRIDCIN
jgi:hypothetical protein